MKITIDLNEDQLEMIKDLIDVDNMSNKDLVEEFIFTHLCVDEDGNEY